MANPGYPWFPWRLLHDFRRGSTAQLDGPLFTNAAAADAAQAQPRALTAQAAGVSTLIPGLIENGSQWIVISPEYTSQPASLKKKLIFH